MSAQLVILAAGVGRRFGGLKQLVPVGPGGEAIMDYTVFDALRHGFTEVVLVIRRETEDDFRRHLETGFGKHTRVTLVHQDLTAVPAGCPVPPNRSKPWGTGQAVLAAAPALTGPFAVANADDYYGTPAIAALARFLQQPATTPPTWAMAGFEVSGTLPAVGRVSRGLVATEAGYLQSIKEIHTVRRHPDGAVWDAPEGERVVPGTTPVSMNLWGFDRSFLTDLESHFKSFLNGEPGDQDEIYLPEVVGAVVNAGQARVAVLPTQSPWCGLTSATDLETVRNTLARFVDEGLYPARLWACFPQKPARL